jgi:hypothetical protein
MEGNMSKQRGVYEKEPGSGVWWIQYFDADGRRQREMVGSRSSAIALVEKRRTDARQGMKMPANLRERKVSFKEIAEEALIWSRAHKKSPRDDEIRMKNIVAQFGDCAAEQISPGDLKMWLDSQAGK